MRKEKNKRRGKKERGEREERKERKQGTCQLRGWEWSGGGIKQKMVIVEDSLATKEGSQKWDNKVAEEELDISMERSKEEEKVGIT